MSADSHFGTYAVYSDDKRVGTHFIWDVGEFPAAWFKPYFRWTRKGFIQWKAAQK